MCIWKMSCSEESAYGRRNGDIKLHFCFICDFSFLQGVEGKETNSALKGKKNPTLLAQQSGHNTKRLLDKTTWAINVLPTIKLQAVTTDSQQPGWFPLSPDTNQYCP